MESAGCRFAQKKGKLQMAKLVWRAGTLLSPVPPALITCGTMEKPNILTVAWTGILNSTPPMTYISVRPERYSHDIIKESGEFVINLTTKSLVRAADFCGVRSGRDMDKFSACHITPEPSSVVSCPRLVESPLSIECRVREIKNLGSHDMFLADIVAVGVEESFVDERGKLHMNRCGLIAYAHGEYFALGESLGTFGFSVKKKGRKKSAFEKRHIKK